MLLLLLPFLATQAIIQIARVTRTPVILTLAIHAPLTKIALPAVPAHPAPQVAINLESLVRRILENSPLAKPITATTVPLSPLLSNATLDLEHLADPVTSYQELTHASRAYCQVVAGSPKVAWERHATRRRPIVMLTEEHSPRARQTTATTALTQMPSIAT